MFPIVRITMEVHYGKNKYAFCFFRIQHAIGESFCLAPSYFSLKDGPGPGVLNGTTDGCINLYGKIETQSRFTFLIVVNSFEELPFCKEKLMSRIASISWQKLVHQE
jgi:hypothetical protein